MTARTLTAPQKRALLWLAERPGEWRYHHPHNLHRRDVMRRLCELGLVEKSDDRIGNRFRLTPAGIQAAKEIADAVA